ncbi:ATP-binding SpoIIE family protein phosphatase [Streptomyces sp. HB2AG]|uniref:ATP-binding SpoIIE family protein phosphatase n=1 Tax=Streptomyces sp. HB2AG TaxID=2983400 RepID=UPI0022AAE464|nr:SpoIIE family protein phosphatase [Streptomyces sp. HB2AG]MCZ2524702.1 SpoIIE family protein phosphatase [Streptomyces sp. HB2AG]
MTDHPDPPEQGREAAVHTSRLAPSPVAALLRLAVVAVGPDGRISYWNHCAGELFGHHWDTVFGRPAAELLPVPAPPAPVGRPAAAAVRAGGGAGPGAFAVLDGLARDAWAGSMAVTTGGGTERDALWWGYRTSGAAGSGLLVLAADAGPLRSHGPRLSLGEGPPSFAAVWPARSGRAVMTVTAGMSRAFDDGFGERLARRLGGVLPGTGPTRSGRAVRQVLRLGLPVLSVDGSLPVPVLPHETPGPAPAAGGRGRPVGQGHDHGRGQARDHGHARGHSRGARRELLPPPRHGLPGRPAPSGTAPPAAVPSGAVPSGAVPSGAAPAPSGGTAVRPLPEDTAAAPAATSSPAPSPVPSEDGAGTRGRGPTALAAAPAPLPPIAAPDRSVEGQLALLRTIGTRLGTTLDPETTARELCSVAVPHLADFAAVLVVDHLFADTDTEPADGDRADGPVAVRRVVLAHEDGAPRWEEPPAEGGAVAPAVNGPRARLGEPLLVPGVDPALAEDLASDLGMPSAGPRLAGRSLLVQPLTARGTVLGRMVLVRDAGRRPFGTTDVATAAELAARGALHLDNARLHRLESRAAATLQRSMLPTRPPRIPGVEIAHRYRPGDRRAQVGGDWFDAVPLPGGRVALVVGDVMGHGLHSAAVMGQFRTAVQTMAALDLPPAQLLRHLDNLAHRLGQDHLATCVYAVYDPIHRTLTLANAGHISPVLARPEGGPSELLQIPHGAPIGVGGVAFETVEVPVPDGSWLVLCTDGLVEVRGQGIDDGLADLCRAVIDPGQTPEEVCDAILGRVHSEDRQDDVALLVARFEGIAPEDVATWQLEAAGEEVRRARALTRKQLADWGLDRLADTTELLVSELVTNALQTRTGPVELRLMRVGKLLVEVGDNDHNLPQLRSAEAHDEDGRGLGLVSHLSTRWGTGRRAVGKVVWFELPLPQ